MSRVLHWSVELKLESFLLRPSEFRVFFSKPQLKHTSSTRFWKNNKYWSRTSCHMVKETLEIILWTWHFVLVCEILMRLSLLCQGRLHYLLDMWCEDMWPTETLLKIRVSVSLSQWDECVCSFVFTLVTTLCSEHRQWLWSWMLC